MNRDLISEKLSRLIVYSIFIFALGIFTSKFLIYLGMGFSLIFWLLKLFLLRSNYKFNKYGFLIPILLFTSSIFISGIGHWNSEILESNFFYSFIFFFILINEINSFEEIKKIIYLMLFSSLIASLFGLYQHYYLGMRRINSFSFPLSWGNFAAVLLFFVITYLFFGDLSRYNKIFLTFFGLILIINLVFTQSRGAWLGFIAALLVLGWLKGRKFLLTTIIVLLLILTFLPENYTDRFISSFNLEYNLRTNRSNAVRIALWHTSLKMLRDNPINGVGYNNYKDVYIDKYKIDGVRPFDHAHNNILNFAAELGLLGLFSFIYLMYIILKKIITYYNSENIVNLKLFHFGSIFLFIIYHVQGLTQYNFGDTETLHFFFFIIALNVVMSNNLTFDEIY